MSYAEQQEEYGEVIRLAEECAKVKRLFTDREIAAPYTDLGGKPTVHDPMVCRGDRQGRFRLTPCADCMQWAFRTLEEIAKIVGVKLPEREELT